MNSTPSWDLRLQNGMHGHLQAHWTSLCLSQSLLRGKESRAAFCLKKNSGLTFRDFFKQFAKKKNIFLWGIPEFLEISYQELQFHFAFPFRVSGIDGWMLSFSWNFNNFRIIYLFPRKFPYVPFVFVGSFRIFLVQWKRPLISCSWFPFGKPSRAFFGTMHLHHW